MSNEINGTNNIRYNYIQTAQMLNENDSTIRYWVSQFKDILHLDKGDGKTIRFTMKDIENLKFIQELIREEHYTIEQVKFYCSEKFVQTPEMVNMDNQLEVKAFMAALKSEIDKSLTEMSNALLEQNKQLMLEVLKSQTSLNETVKSELSETLTTIISDTANSIKDTQKTQLEEVIKDMQDTSSNIKSSINDSISSSINNKYDSMENSINELKEIAKNTQEDVSAIKKTAYVTEDQLKEYENRGLLNKIRNIFK